MSQSLARRRGHENDSSRVRAVGYTVREFDATLGLLALGHIGRLYKVKGERSSDQVREIER